MDRLGELSRSCVLAASFACACGVGGLLLALNQDIQYRANAILMLNTATVHIANAKNAADLHRATLDAGLSPYESRAAIASIVKYLASQRFTDSFLNELGAIGALVNRPSLSEAQHQAARGTALIEQARKTFDEKVRHVYWDRDSDVISVSIDWTDPVLAAAWCNRLVRHLNDRLREQAVAAVDARISFLRASDRGSGNVAVERSLASAMNLEIQRRALFVANQEFAVRVVDPAIAPDAQNRNAAFVLAFVGTGLAFGLLLGVMTIFMIRLAHFGIAGQPADDLSRSDPTKPDARRWVDLTAALQGSGDRLSGPSNSPSGLSVTDAAGIAYLALVLLLPFVLFLIKGALACLWLVGRLAARRAWLSPPRALAASAALAYAIFQTVFILYGQINGAPHESLLFTVPLNIVFPLFMASVCFVVTAADLRFVLRISEVLAPWVAAYLIAFFLGGIGVLPWNIPSTYETSIVAYAEGEAGIDHPLVSILLWITPCYVVGLLARSRFGMFNGFLNVVGATLILIAVVLSSRRSIVLTTAVAVLVFIGLSMVTGRVRAGLRAALRVAGLGVVALTSVILVAVALELNLSAYVDSLTLSPNTTSQASESDRMRADQKIALLKAGRESMALGKGIGSYTRGLVRDESKPWRYEMGFYAALFRFGVIGTLAYLGIVAWIYWLGVIAVNAGHSFGDVDATEYVLMAAVGGQLIGYLVNPILDSLDTAWELFVPALLFAALGMGLFRNIAGRTATVGGATAS